MKNAFNYILTGIVAAGLPALFATAAHGAEGYLMDANGGFVRSGTGACWHTGYWTPELAVAECDPVAKHGEKPQPKGPAMPPPAQPQQASVPAIVKSQALPKKITFSEEDLFDFDKAELRPRGKEKLDSLVNDLKGGKYGMIHVIGYTDRIGAKEYNLRLSSRRADAVRDYLVKAGIPENLIDAEGRGEADPITKPSDCKDMSDAKAIACLQPDRRVEVTVQETK